MQGIDISSVDLYKLNNGQNYHAGLLSDDLDAIRYLSPQLKVLQVAERTDLDDATVRQICKSFTSLQELHINGCPQLTDDAVADLPAASNLTLLNLSGCSGISRKAVKKLKLSSSPNLKVMY